MGNEEIDKREAREVMRRDKKEARKAMRRDNREARKRNEEEAWQGNEEVRERQEGGKGRGQ